jgi:hypothetical protein
MGHAISTREEYGSIEQTRIEPLLATTKLHIQHFPLRWFASTIPKCTHGFVPGY